MTNISTQLADALRVVLNDGGPAALGHAWEALAAYDAQQSEPQLAYLASHGSHCPSCNSHDIDGGHIEIDNSSATQEVSCNVCGSSWFDTYTLTGFTDFNLED